MRKDSERFLKKALGYREKTGQDAFELNINYFADIPNITTGIKDVLADLIRNNCLTSESKLLNLEYDISIYLTIDGITYFDDDKKELSSSVVFNVTGGQVNFANGKIDAVMNDRVNKELKKEQNEENHSKEDIQPFYDKSDKLSKKVFISYSWTPENNKEWVRKLVQNLEKDGVQVVIDYKDLKLGYDKYAFMERIVTDETIDKVLIICNRAYKEKADSRNGGVGDESAIITPQIYGNTKQEKFIPVINEYNEEGIPYLPNYLATRMYADLVDFDEGYKELLHNILDKGKKPILEEEQTLERSMIINRDIENFGEPTPFFDYRFRKAFPGVRGIKEFNNPEECVDRLAIMLRKPLNSKKQGMMDPIWWFRGGSNLDIDKFERLSSTKFLMNTDEIEVKKITVYSSSHYFRKFVYVEGLPEQTSGAYGEINEEDINEMVRLSGEYHEEYALYEGNVITRAEYDDGAAVIDGKIVEFGGKAELRVRYLTPYNFIICAKWNPLNESRYDDIVEDILNGMLKGTNTIDDLANLCEKLPRHRMDR